MPVNVFYGVFSEETVRERREAEEGIGTGRAGARNLIYREGIHFNTGYELAGHHLNEEASRVFRR
jgi:hypothetical protein